MRVFFVVLARDSSLILGKIKELESFGYPYVIVCGERFSHPNVVFKRPVGKYDAINFSLNYIPVETDVVVFNDVDAEINNFACALELFEKSDISLVYAKVRVEFGPQLLFYRFLDALRRWVPIAASGELVLLRYEALRRVLPLKRCKSEDSYILFKVLENGGRIAFCEDCFVRTLRTLHAKQEEAYKRRTTGGIYQALSMTKTSFLVRVFYAFLPFVSPLLLLTGKKGYYWSKGIIQGIVDYVRGDSAGTWVPNYSDDS